MIPVKDNVPVDRFPLATVALIVANIVVYLVAAHAAPRGVTVGSVLGSIFVHSSIVQLIGNVWFLWLFGTNVEDAMGPVRFLGFYLAGGLIALGVVLAVDPGAPTPTVGAAGAVGAVLGGYVLLYPRARVLALVVVVFFFGVLEIPTLVMLLAWIAMQGVFAATGLIGDGGFAYVSYIGGFLFGLAAIRLPATRRKPTPPTAAAYR
ncbi:MAG TPA: rhomboid family intramembrane serine protease [Solirubrobacteraceae bacterium]|nr:rhomboid family intramembrane serine protease [Solirubrobacteraceae bacterium]